MWPGGNGGDHVVKAWWLWWWFLLLTNVFVVCFVASFDAGWTTEILVVGCFVFFQGKLLVAA